ncbi:MAG: selenide, water dikinase SelD, partial [Chloroflexi bacterium CFX6]|nr:selenide, water dikinase SelD [Chloroflexi bacterium CFX6]
RAAVAAGASAATDITGFGLAGHGLEMAERSGVTLSIDVEALPLLPGAWTLAGAGMAPGGTGRNRDAFGPRVAGLTRLAAEWSSIVFDPQTSGGLLIAVAPGATDRLAGELAAHGVLAARIGTVVEASDDVGMVLRSSAAAG